MALFRNHNEGSMADMIRCDEEDYLIWKWRPVGNEANSTNKENSIRWGSSLRVKDGEVAVFVYRQNGGVQDFIVGPNDEVIKTANFPVLSSIVGLAFGGGTPFQAEVYFINLAGNVQVKFGVPFFDVFDPRYLDFGVPIAVRGTITFNVSDYKTFIKLNRLIEFEVDTFKEQIRDSVIRYVKGIVANVPGDLNMPVVQIERRILEINDWVEQRLKSSLETDFAVNIKRLDISAIDVKKDSEGYRKLREITADIAERKTMVQADVEIKTLEAQADVNIQNMEDAQRINAGNLEEQLRMQREEMQRAQKLKTESTFLETHKLNIQTDAQKEILKAAAENLGTMGTADFGGGGTMNPAGMMTGMMLGGAMGNQMANMVNQMGSSMPAMNQGTATPPGPPPPPISEATTYIVVINGQQSGPFNVQELHALFMQGQFNSQSFVWKQGMADWAHADQLLDLRPIFQGPPPVPPSPQQH